MHKTYPGNDMRQRLFPLSYRYCSYVWMLKNCRRSLRGAGGGGTRGNSGDNAGPIDYPVLHIYACTSRLMHLRASPSRHKFAGAYP